MFTGIVKYLRQVKSVKVVQDHLRIVVDAPELLKNPLGSSIMVNGACLTLVSTEEDYLNFDVISESLNNTNLGLLKIDDFVNLEPSLSLKDGIDGHLVTGHVDFKAKFLKVSDSNEYYFELPKTYTKYIALKGSVTVNGISLTVSEVSDAHYFKVSLIPATLNHTNFQFLTVSSLVNVEVDLLARYMEKLISK